MAIEFQHPEFDATVVSSFGDAMLRVLREDAPLAGYLAEITDAETEDTFLASGYAKPALLVALDEMEERRQPGGWSELDLVWQLTLVTEIRSGRGTDGWLRARIFERIKTVLTGPEHGVFRDELGNLLNDALIAFQRIGPPLRSPDGTDLRTRARVGWTFSVDSATRALLP